MSQQGPGSPIGAQHVVPATAFTPPQIAYMPIIPGLGPFPEWTVSLFEFSFNGRNYYLVNHEGGGYNLPGPLSCFAAYVQCSLPGQPASQYYPCIELQVLSGGSYLYFWQTVGSGVANAPQGATVLTGTFAAEFQVQNVGGGSAVSYYLATLSGQNQNNCLIQLL